MRYLPACRLLRYAPARRTDHQTLRKEWALCCTHQPPRPLTHSVGLYWSYIVQLRDGPKCRKFRKQREAAPHTHKTATKLASCVPGIMHGHGVERLVHALAMTEPGSSARDQPSSRTLFFLASITVLRSQGKPIRIIRGSTER